MAAWDTHRGHEPAEANRAGHAPHDETRREYTVV
jgi:hypothetical protein